MKINITDKSIISVALMVFVFGGLYIFSRAFMNAVYSGDTVGLMVFMLIMTLAAVIIGASLVMLMLRVNASENSSVVQNIMAMMRLNAIENADIQKRMYDAQLKQQKLKTVKQLPQPVRELPAEIKTPPPAEIFMDIDESIFDNV